MNPRAPKRLFLAIDTSGEVESHEDDGCGPPIPLTRHRTRPHRKRERRGGRCARLPFFFPMAFSSRQEAEDYCGDINAQYADMPPLAVVEFVRHDVAAGQAFWVTKSDQDLARVRELSARAAKSIAEFNERLDRGFGARERAPSPPPPKKKGRRR